MATYDFHCQHCDLNFDKQLPLAKYRDPQKCPTCGQADFVTRVFSAPAISYRYPAGHARAGRGGTGRTKG